MKVIINILMGLSLISMFVLLWEDHKDVFKERNTKNITILTGIMVVLLILDKIF